MQQTKIFGLTIVIALASVAIVTGLALVQAQTPTSIPTTTPTTTPVPSITPSGQNDITNCPNNAADNFIANCHQNGQSQVNCNENGNHDSMMSGLSHDEMMNGFSHGGMMNGFGSGYGNMMGGFHR